MERKPTVIGGDSSTAPVVVAEVLPPLRQDPVAPRNTGAIVLRPEQQAAMEQALSALDFKTMPTGEIVRLGHEAEQGLHKTLNGFLAGLDKNNAALVFGIFNRLEKGVKDAKLPELAEKIKSGGKPGVLASVMGRFRGKRPMEIAHGAYEEVRGVLSGTTKTLVDEVSKLETELVAEMQKLFAELQSLNRLKVSYRDHASDFAVVAGLAQAFLEESRKYVEAKAAEVAKAPDAQAQVELGELRQKLQLLESRALALEGTYTRLPADQLVTQQIEQAGLATLQETATTASARIASIKMTLLALNGALAVKSVQNLGEAQARLDDQLSVVRGSVMNEVVTAAANAPGDNRLAQAQQIMKIVTETQAIHEMVEQARKDNDQKFAQARGQLRVARDTLANMPS